MSSRPAGPVSSWLFLLAVPVLAYAVGLVAMPRPASVEAVRTTQLSLSGDAIRRDAPSPKTPFQVSLGRSVRIIGGDLPDVSLSRGSRLTTRFYFACDRSLDRDWQIFVHIDGRDASYRLHGDHFPARGSAPTTSWKPGDFIVDTWERAIPADMPSGVYDVWIGLYAGNDRLPFTGGDRERHDGENRFRVGTITVE